MTAVLVSPKEKLGKVPIDPPQGQTLVPLHEEHARAWYIGLESKAVYLENKETGKWYRLFAKSSKHELTGIQKHKARLMLGYIDKGPVSTEYYDREFFIKAVESHYCIPIDELRIILA